MIKQDKQVELGTFYSLEVIFVRRDSNAWSPGVLEMTFAWTVYVSLLGTMQEEDISSFWFC